MASPNAAGTSGAKESTLTALISRLDSRKIPYFHKVMTKMAVTQLVLGPLAYALGFPVRFVRAHGTEFGELALFQLATNCDQTWPVEITVKVDPAGKSQVFAYGPGGWKAFLVDNDIRVGDTLVFSLVGFSNFTIDIIKAARARAEDQEEEEERSLDPSSFPKNIEEAASLPGCKRCKKVPSQSDTSPRFVVNVGPKEVKQLRVPGNFWERFRDMLPSRDWELSGPNGTVMMVEAAANFYEAEQELDIHLKSRGWKHFLKENELRIGDLLEFSLVAQDCFLVDVVQRL